MKTKRDIKLKILMIVFLSLFLIFAFFVIKDYYFTIKEHRANDQIADLVKNVRDDAPFAADLALDMVYEELHKQNEDMAGWISIEGTGLDYPVMYTPNNPEYYMRRGFDKKYAFSGSLFISDGCTPNGNHVIIYGHNVKADGSMFGYLLNYDSYNYFKNHPTIKYDTLEQKGEYEIMSVFYSEVYTSYDVGYFRYYNYPDLSDPDTFDYYIAAALSSSLYDTGVTAEYGDQILTLSTCSYHKENGRFVVVARKIK